MPALGGGRLAPTQQTADDTPVSRFPVERFRRAMETGDVEGVVENWTEDCVVRSLGPKRLGFEGKEEARLFVAALLGSCESFEYTEEIRTDDTILLFLRARFAGLSLEGVDFLKINEQGQCTEFAVRVRPYMQASVLVGRVAVHLTRGGGLVRRLLIGILVPPLDVAQRLGYRGYNRLLGRVLRDF